MYYIINRTTNQTTVHHGDWPNLNEQLTNGEDIIVVSLYSNTIKTPYMENDCWEWKDYDIPFLSSHMDTDYPDDEEYTHGEDECYDYDEHTSAITDEPEINTDYVIASTSEMMEETMVFPANEDGQITDYTDLNCVALRYGRYDWEDAFSAVAELNTDEYKYIFVKHIYNKGNLHNLFKKINTSDIVVI
jgi:hypothetical protein